MINRVDQLMMLKDARGKKCEAQIVAHRQYCVRRELICSLHSHTPRYTRPYIPTQMDYSIYYMYYK